MQGDGGDTEQENHKYYLVHEMQTDSQHPYIDLDRLNQSLPHSIVEHSMLSNSYRRAATISLNFRFLVILDIYFDHTIY